MRMLTIQYLVKFMLASAELYEVPSLSWLVGSQTKVNTLIILLSENIIFMISVDFI